MVIFITHYCSILMIPFTLSDSSVLRFPFKKYCRKLTNAIDEIKIDTENGFLFDF